jgi:hypothetical protein
VLIEQASSLFAPLTRLAREARMVFLAGLPGTGKSLLIRELAHLAHAGGRRIHLLQWDVARPAFEASEAGRRYPQVDGITHGLIRLAVGRWARRAVARWHAEHGGPEHLLIGETPFIGHRLIELARPAPDAAEPVLAAPHTRFVIPVPSRELRRHLEAERGRRAGAPLHPREREDAPPHVLRTLWAEVAVAAAALGLVEAAPAAGGGYDPDVYRRVYERLLGHRHVEVLATDTPLPVAGVSAYDLRVPAPDLLPTPEEAEHFIAEAVAGHPDPAAVQARIDTWYLPSAGPPPSRGGGAA